MNPTETTTELYRKYRPRKLSEVVGQEEAVETLKEFLSTGKMPHALLLTGPSGCGKTTLARILRRRLGCGPDDYQEMNSADFRGIDTVRDVRSRMGLSPINGTCRVWLFDECHKLSNDAQNAFLKLLEDTPSHVFFILGTTDPERLLTTVRTRTTQVHLTLLRPEAMKTLVDSVLEKEGAQLTDEVKELLIDKAEGSARQVLVLLGSVLQRSTPEKQLSLLEKLEAKEPAIKLARCLLNPRSRWNEAAAIIRSITTDEEPETIRRMILGYATKVLESGGKMAPRAFLIIDTFRDDFYDAGRAKLAACAYEVCTTK